MLVSTRSSPASGWEAGVDSSSGSAYREAVKGTDVLSDATVGEDLEAWLKRKKSLARTTTNGYEDQVRLYLQPHLGQIKRRDCKLRHVEAMCNAIEKENAERLIHHARIVELQETRDAAHTAWVRASGNVEERRRTRRAYLVANAALREGRKGKRKVTSATTMLGHDGRAAADQAVEGAGLDTGAGCRLEAHGPEAQSRDGLDPGADWRVSGLHRRRQAGGHVARVHLPGSAPRRDVRAALE
ncbi:hypothetical protein [Streptomyces stackebrandtii]|uniref:hypothetical protein n=1 Tax=Streptomyces stackebrandtii TaxID=3051177 RepID=UPI0028DC58A4|nr:hypothetical protein [Streptomyces sp. DSM 40976]